MSSISKPERVTQNRVVQLFTSKTHPGLGYDYLGDWSDRESNRNVEPSLLSAWLTNRGFTDDHVSRALEALRRESDNPNRSLYENNHEVYKLLRYGVPVKLSASDNTVTVRLIDWDHPDKNHFAIAEEVTLSRDEAANKHERRPDIVLYVNGIAIGVLELKRSSVDVSEAIRQCRSLQDILFQRDFFSTVQFCFAGNDTQGLRYGTTGTSEKYFLDWKDPEDTGDGHRLDRQLTQMCNKARLIELMHDFVLFDGGVKKLPRVHQYFGAKAAQERITERKGGVIWHTQGSGKSILMVLLAKWVLENNPNARVLFVTDRVELEQQIGQVLHAAGAITDPQTVRANSRVDLQDKLSSPSPRVISTLIHKFGSSTDDFPALLKALKAAPSKTVGDVVVFVDECHRTNSVGQGTTTTGKQKGKLHKLMKALLPNATFVGFTGTPLLKKDKATSQEVFGTYIHRYTFKDAVEDGVVLDLVYEARDVEQSLSSPEKVDKYFASKAKGLNQWQQDELQRVWATKQKVLSSKPRMQKIVADILWDFETRPGLNRDRGTAILVAGSIAEACAYYRLFQGSSAEHTVLRDRCAVITSYNPHAGDVSKEETGGNSKTDKQAVYETYVELLKSVTAQGGLTATETYEREAKRKFINEPANMQLLIVVDKLLTGFDAPTCTYLYIDKSMQDHGLFQAICRTNRLDGPTKPFGYIVDYKDLFRKVEKAIAVYTSELDHEAGENAPEILLKDRLQAGRERLEDAREAIEAVIEPVEPPRGELEYLAYFVGNASNPSDLADREGRRSALYIQTATLVRAYANIADELEGAKYSASEIDAIKKQVNHYAHTREAIRLAAGEVLDVKAYEADMRMLLDSYVHAEDSKSVSPWNEDNPVGLLDVIVNSGIAAAIQSLPASTRSNKRAVAETIANNVRSKITKSHLQDPAFYNTLSELLTEVLDALREERIEYAEYLERVDALVKQVQAGHGTNTPSALRTPAQRALYNNLGQDEDLALRVDAAVLQHAPADWRGHQAREAELKNALYAVLKDVDETVRVFDLVVAQQEY